MIDNTNLKHSLLPLGCYSPLNKINKAIFIGQIVISAPLINFHLSNAHLRPTKCMMK